MVTKAGETGGNAAAGGSEEDVMADVTVRVSVIGWTVGGDIHCQIDTSDGRSGFLYSVPDGRISAYGENANVEFGSATLDWCDWLIQAILPQLQSWLAKQQVANPALRQKSI